MRRSVGLPLLSLLIVENLHRPIVPRGAARLPEVVEGVRVEFSVFPGEGGEQRSSKPFVPSLQASGSFLPTIHVLRSGFRNFLLVEHILAPGEGGQQTTKLDRSEAYPSLLSSFADKVADTSR